ncbi:AraC family transcriptional regulator [Kaistia dalseonensis]|uniref:AraC-like DNA-binding protein n=1 Tax=Kaistia dalseonensis TaxID=410840 RepID=A0ABU0H8Y1_9HYPH|nr:AraC family transcriptional regulator [Kaistia dalseonensis]MCX5496160.1 AraC family transcriptional regulator [Kaistia dalseonensis]MDQ0438770.1 AraC-like DNA-binding protein [Kaistia dalseonensis]
MTDPLSDVLTILGARVTRRTRLEASGEWALAFPALDRLKFVALLRGASWIMVEGRPPQRMAAGDVCLLGRTAYAVASDPELPPLDGQALYGTPGCDAVRLGGDDMVSIGGTVAFAEGNAGFLLDMLPDFLFIPKSTAASGAMAAVLALIDGEVGRDLIGGDIISARLADVFVVEAIRAYAASAAQFEIGWLGALADPRLGRALRAIHGDIARPWTVADLAQVAGMSRAAFSAAFTRRVGEPPLAYVRAWRLTMARAALASGEESVASIAGKVGYTSQSAFGHAFRSAFGAAPRAHARS